MVPMKKRLISLVLIIILLSTTQIPSGLSQDTTLSPMKINPEDPAVMEVAGNELSVSKWGGFSTVTISMPTIKGFTDYLYETSQHIEGYEINLILLKIPSTNIFYYPITVKNAEFYYQPPLTPEEVSRGNVRPENVVGSYAVYGPKKNNEFGTGKIMHIYRPKVIDAKGNWVWGVLDYKNGILSVTVDSDWLKNALYPVTIDPIFGNNGVGASDLSLTDNYLYGMQATSPTSANMYVYKFTAYVKTTGGGDAHYKSGLWVNSDGGAVINVSSESTLITASYTWKNATLYPPFLINASTDYLIGILGKPTQSVSIRYDSTGATTHLDADNDYATPEPINWNADYTYELSLYATCYHVSSAITDLDDSDNVYAMKKYYNFTTIVSDDDGATDIKSISLRGMQSSTVRWLVNATDLDSTPSYAIVEGASTIDLDTGSCSFTESGINGTLLLMIRFEWDITNEDGCEIAVWMEDVGLNSPGWTTVQSNYFDVITRLTTYQLGANNTSPAVSSPVKISGYVRYCTSTDGLTSSASYPPNAQFTTVKIYDDEDNLAGSNATIVNGFFSIAITSSAIIETVAYHAYLDLVPDYTDGDAPDGDLVYVTTTASFYVVDQIKQAFELYGVAWSTIPAMLTGIASYWGTAAASVLSFFINIIIFVNFCAGSVIYWLNLFVSFFIQLFTICGDVIDGSATVSTGLGNMWELIGFATWASFVPVVIFIIWWSGLSVRSKKSGRSELELIVGDLQVVSYIVGEVFNWSYQVFNFMVNMLISLAGLLVG
jgi:hypothetical protein